MARPAASTVEEYLQELPADRRAVVSAVRDLVLAHLPPGYRECFAFGMIGYVIPLERYPKTYNGQPLSYIGLAAQKSHYALYMMSVYGDPRLEAELREGFAKANLRLDMGKSCIRFRKLEDLPLDVIGALVARVPVERYIETYERARAR